MAIILNDNIKINAGKPADAKYLNLSNQPYGSTGETNATIPITERYVGLTVNVLGLEYWYKDGVADGDLVLKTVDAGAPVSDFITGATNIGFFSGTTAVQTLPITYTSDSSYNGNYQSQYTFFYRNSSGIISVGKPSDGIFKRGYVKTTAPVKSFIWNEYVGAPDNQQLGWILIDGNINDQIGTFQQGIVYYPAWIPYTNTFWVQNTAYNNGSNLIISNVIGNLTSGTTLTVGGPVYAQNVNNTLEFRTIKSKTPDLLSVDYDATFVYLSGATAVLSGQNVGTTGFNTAGVFSQRTGTTMQFRRIVGGGNTVVSEVGDSIVLFTSISGQTSITGGTNIGFTGGTGVFDSRDDKTLQFRNLVGSGDTTVSLSGNSVIIYSEGGSDFYVGESPTVCTVGGVPIGYDLTGKTLSCIIQDIFVPELCGTIIAPSTSINLSSTGTYEVGSILSQTVSGTFSRGSINPQYCSASPFRSGCANAYCFTGTGMPSGWQVCALTPGVANNPSHTVISGSQSWGVCTRYDAGQPALGSKGTEYCAALISGNTGGVSAIVTGLYPYFYGKVSSGSRPAVTNNLVTGGTKMVASSTGTVTVNFSSSGEWTWLAIPATSTSKTCWYVNPLDNGKINNAPSDKYPDECALAITSGQGCWLGINYKIYMSGFAATDADPIQFRNS